MAIALYFTSGSCSLAAHWALLEAGLSHDLVAVNLAAGEQRTPEFRKVNPHGRVPVLVVDGKIITELPSILFYIAGRAPTAKLLPFDEPLAMARALELLMWFSSTVQVSFSQAFRPERFTDCDETKAVLKRDAKSRILAHFGEIEALMATADPWLFGENLSVADLHAFVLLNWAPRLEIDAADYPAWHAHAHRLLRRPSAARLLAAENWTPAIPGAALPA